MKCLARVNSPNVVWRADSGPNGTKSFSFSKQVLSWARLHKIRKWLKHLSSDQFLRSRHTHRCRTESAGCWFALERRYNIAHGKIVCVCVWPFQSGPEVYKRVVQRKNLVKAKCKPILIQWDEWRVRIEQWRGNGTPPTIFGSRYSGQKEVGGLHTHTHITNETGILKTTTSTSCCL